MSRVRCLAVLLAILVIGQLFLSCRPKDEEGKETISTVKVIVRTGPEADALNVVADSFQKKTGIRVEINAMGRDAYMNAMPARLLARSAATDVFFTPSTMIGEFAQAGVLEPLETFIRTDDDLLVSYGVGGHIYALPTDVSTLFLFYRKDLIATPPGTWDDLLTVAQRFSRSRNAASPTSYGLGFSGKGPEEPPKVFYPILWSYGGSVLDEKEKVVLDSPQAVRAAEYYQKLITSGAAPEAVTTWSYPEVVQALSRGDIAMAAPMWNAAYADIRNGSSPLRNKIEVAPIPGVLADGDLRRVDFQHGWTLVLNARSRNKPDAAQFIAFATGREGGEIYAKAGGTPARRSILSSPELRAKRPEFGLVLEMLRVARAEPVVPYYNDMHSVMNTMLTNLILQRQTPQVATQEAAAAIRQVATRK